MNNLMRRSGIIALLSVLLCLCLLICSCGGGEEGSGETSAVTTDAATDPVVTDPVDTNPVDTTPVDTTPVDTDPIPETATYTVVVKDADGNPIANVEVKICDGDLCLPGTTNAEGVATIDAVVGNYTAGVTAAVEGYVVDTAAEYAVDAETKTATIVLEAVAAEEDEKEADGSKENPYNVKDIADNWSLGVTDGVTPIYVANVEELLELEEEATIYYTYEATGDGMLWVEVVNGLGSGVSITNVTTGVVCNPLSGNGEVGLQTVAGNSYEIVVTSPANEAFAYEISFATEPDGSKENPYWLVSGAVEVDVTVPAGETVWYLYVDEYFLIEDPSAKVSLNGTLFAPNADGNILGTNIGLDMFDLVGISSVSEEDDVITVQLSGSSELAPLSMVMDMDMDGDEFTVIIPANSMVYIQPDFATNEVYSSGFKAYIADAPETVGFYSEGRFGPSYSVATEITPRTMYVVLANTSGVDKVVTFSVSEASKVEGSQGNPIVLEEAGAGNIDAMTMALNASATMWDTTETTVYMTYTATEDCVVTLDALNEYDFPAAGVWKIDDGSEYGSSAWENTETGVTATLKAGETVWFTIQTDSYTFAIEEPAAEA